MHAICRSRRRRGARRFTVLKVHMFDSTAPFFFLFFWVFPSLQQHVQKNEEPKPLGKKIYSSAGKVACNLHCPCLLCSCSSVKALLRLS
jgi:hypothetical protein